MNAFDKNQKTPDWAKPILEALRNAGIAKKKISALVLEYAAHFPYYELINIH